VFVLDQRMSLPDGMKLAGSVYRVKATLFSRLSFEWRLRHLLPAKVRLLCMGSLPPLFAHQGEQLVFVQNRYLVDGVALDSFCWPVRVRLMVERKWLRSRAKYVKRFFAQTPTMQRLINHVLDVDAEILPFNATVVGSRLHAVDDRELFDFLYVASGEPHKNHRRLIDAWVKLAEKGLFPSLCLTLCAERFPDLCAWISYVTEKFGLNVRLIGECSYTEIQHLYRQSSALIFPSLFESFGLPLIESVNAGLPVLASRSSYVTDVIRPTEQFDPLSSDGIAEAVKHFSFKPSFLNIELLTADEFLQQIFKAKGE